MSDEELDEVLDKLDDAQRRMNEAIPIAPRSANEQPPTPTEDEWRNYVAAHRDFDELWAKLMKHYRDA